MALKRVHSADIDVRLLTIVGHYLLDFPDNLGAREPWSGGLDDMQIWNTPLSESEFSIFMNCPPSRCQFFAIGISMQDKGTALLTSVVVQDLDERNGLEEEPCWLHTAVFELRFNFG